VRAGRAVPVPRLSARHGHDRGTGAHTPHLYQSSSAGHSHRAICVSQWSWAMGTPVVSGKMVPYFSGALRGTAHGWTVELKATRPWTFSQAGTPRSHQSRRTDASRRHRAEPGRTSRPRPALGQDQTLLTSIPDRTSTPPFVSVCGAAGTVQMKRSSGFRPAREPGAMATPSCDVRPPAPSRDAMPDRLRSWSPARFLQRPCP
jgi:hypothetical protein